MRAMKVSRKQKKKPTGNTNARIQVICAMNANCTEARITCSFKLEIEEMRESRLMRAMKANRKHQCANPGNAPHENEPETNVRIQVICAMNATVKNA